MPTKRELIPADGPADGFQWSDVRWTRIGAFVGGVVCSTLYFRIDPFQYLPGWAGLSLTSVPIGLMFYGLTEQSWQACLKFTIGIGMGTGLPVFLGSLGLDFLP